MDDCSEFDTSTAIDRYKFRKLLQRTNEQREKGTRLASLLDEKSEGVISVPNMFFNRNYSTAREKTWLQTLAYAPIDELVAVGIQLAERAYNGCDGVVHYEERKKSLPLYDPTCSRSVEDLLSKSGEVERALHLRVLHGDDKILEPHEFRGEIFAPSDIEQVLADSHRSVNSSYNLFPSQLESAFEYLLFAKDRLLATSDGALTYVPPQDRPKSPTVYRNNAA